MRLARTGWQSVLLACAGAVLVNCSPGDRSDSGEQTVAPASSERPPPAATDDAAPSSRPIVAETLPYAEVDNELVYGYFAIPVDMIDPLPAVIVIHDWWGLNPQMRETVEQLAAEGYIVLGVDLFRGGTATAVGKARELEIEVVEDPGLAVENLEQALDFLLNTAGAPRVATVGFGFGGGWSLNAAIEMSDELSACVSYYGQVVDNADALAQVTAPILGLYAEGDRAVPAAAVSKFQDTLESLDKVVDIQIYQQARRGFADQLSDNYNASISADAWNRVLDFLEAEIGESID